MIKIYALIIFSFTISISFSQVDNIYQPPNGGVGFWLDNDRWTLGIPTANHNVIINSGTVVMEGNFGFNHVANSVTISNGARLRINEAGHTLTTTSTTAITIEEDGLITLENGDFGELTLNSGRNIINNGFISLVNIILDNGMIENSSTGVIENTSITGNGNVINNGEIKTVSGNFNLLSNVNVENNNFFEVRGGLRLNEMTFTNSANATLDIQSSIVELDDDQNGFIINEGLIVKTGPSQTSAIEMDLENRTGATVQTNTGTLFIRPIDATTLFLDGSIINVQPSSSLIFESETIELSGTMEGSINGNFSWTGTIAAPINSDLNFTGNEPLIFNGVDITGGGILTNNSTIEVIGSLATNLIGNTQFDNNDLIIFDSNFDIENGTLNNLEDGIFDLNFTGFVFQEDGIHELNNFGLIRKNLNNNSTFTVNFNNSGVLDIINGTIRAQGSQGFINEENGTIMGTGILENFQSNASYTNNGILSPGPSTPGQLFFNGDYSSENSSILRLDINGLTPISEYDRLSVIGVSNAELNGNLELNLGFEPTIGDEFVVLTIANGTITECNFPDSIIASFNGINYEFSLECRNNFEVVLTFTNTLDVNDFGDFENQISIYPNPAIDFITIDNPREHLLSTAEILDLNGRIIQKIYLTQNQINTISINDLASGLYLLKISNKENSTTKKFMKMN